MKDKVIVRPRLEEKIEQTIKKRFMGDVDYVLMDSNSLVIKFKDRGSIIKRDDIQWIEKKGFIFDSFSTFDTKGRDVTLSFVKK